MSAIPLDGIPARAAAERLLTAAAQRNPGPWIDHSRYVAQAAAAIARAHPELDEESAYIVGLLHDVGRQEGVTNMRHGFNDYTLPRWRAYLALRDQFSAAVGRSIYELLSTSAVLKIV
jgi:HD superfamily phosphohydrolase YqeK